MVGNDQRYYMYYPRIQAVCQAPFRVLSPLPAFRRQKSKPCILQSRLAYAIMPIGKKTKCFLAKQQNENPRMRVRGFSIPFNSGGLNHRLVTGYLSLSNHLQMRWQTTPATTVTIKKTKCIPLRNTPSPYRYRGGNAPIILHTSRHFYIFIRLSVLPRICLAPDLALQHGSIGPKGKHLVADLRMSLPVTIAPSEPR